MEAITLSVPPNQRPTARELAYNADPPMQIAGKPADVCPYCGCAMFVSSTRTGEVDKFRYVQCRNQSCGKKFYSRQPPAVIVREVNSREEFSSEHEGIIQYREVG